MQIENEETVNPSIDPPARPRGTADRTRFMTPDLVRRTEAALGSVGAFGEVRLIIEKGRVRFIEVVHSESLDRCPDTQEPPR